MTRRLLAVFSLVAPLLTGCGAYYYEGDGTATPANVAAQAQVQESTTQLQTDEVAIGAQEDLYEDTDPTALTEFRTTLDPYGSWYEDDVYGTVWVPSTTVVGADFAPYVTAGHWVYQDEYVWVSDYDWGWAPFHYGRWVWISSRGWSWIPGRRYAGAWVNWRVGYDGYGYVGWAPMPPSWYWRGGYAYGLGWYPTSAYVFCSTEHLFAPRVSVNVIAGPRVQELGARTRPWTPAGPSVGGSASGPRVSASPTVRGNGPPPTELGIQSAPRPDTSNAGLLRAQQLSRPSTATQIGARAPMLGRAPDAFGRVSPSSTVEPTVPRYATPSPTVRGPVPSYATRPQPTVISPSSGAQPYFSSPPSNGSVATAPQPFPQYRPMPAQVRPQPQPQILAPQPQPRFSQPQTQTIQPAQPRFSQPSFSSPSFQAQPSFQSRPSFQPSTPMGSPSMGSPSMGSPSMGASPRFSSPSVGPSFSSPSVGGRFRR